MSKMNNGEARFFMWCRLVVDYAHMYPEDRKALKKTFAIDGSLQHLQPNEEDIKKAESMLGHPMTITNYDINGPITGTVSLDTSQCVPQPRMSVVEKEKTMYYDDDCDCCSSSAPYSETKAQKAYLSYRLNDAESKKDADLQVAFGLRDDDRPQSAQEVADRILAGKFVLSPNNKDSFAYDPLFLFTWRDPAIQKDAKGYQDALKTLQSQERDAMDAIMVGTADEGLAAVKAFEAATVH